LSGHSKWSQIKRQKGVNDARRGQIFTKLAREVTLAAKEGGPSPDGNVRLRLAIQKAKENSMPMENVERAIKRATGGDGGAAQLLEITYEGYGPGGAAILLQAVTDNKNRTTSDVRSAFTRAGGTLGATGAVSWVFEPKGIITIEADKQIREDIALQAIDAGADDVKLEEELMEIYTSANNLEKVRQALVGKGIRVTEAELSMVPKSTTALDAKTAEQTLKLMDRLEELDDIHRVYTNAEFPNEALESYRRQG